MQATNILKQIDKLNALRPKAREEYDFLSEVTHPNSLGAFHFFGTNPDVNDLVTFSDGGTDPRADLQWILAACHMLTYFEAALNRIDTELPALSEMGRLAAPSATSA